MTPLAFINQRLSIPARLMLLAALFGVATALLLGLYVRQSFKDIAFGQKELDGTTYLAAVWPLFGPGGARGPADGAARFQEVRARFDATFDATKAADAFAAASLSDRLTTGTRLFSKVADGSNLTLDPDLDSYYVMDAVTVHIPAAISALADLRAALKAPAATRPIDVAVAYERLEGRAHQASSDLETAIRNNASGTTDRALSNKLKTFAAAVEALHMLRADALTARTDEGQVDVNRLSAAISAVDEAAADLGLAANSELAQLLSARLGGFYRDLARNLLAVALTVGIGVVLSLAIGGGLSRRISMLLEVMNRLIAGNVPEHIPFLDDQNETGGIARTLAAFKTSLHESATLRADSARRDVEVEAERRAQTERDEAVRTAQMFAVERIERGLSHLARGQLTFHLDEPFAPDYETLRKDFNAATTQLREVLSVVAQNTKSLRSATQNIADGSDELARRTERQAGSLEEASAALGQINETIGKTRDSAAKAHDLIRRAKHEAEQSGAIMGQAVVAMSEINKSSSQMGQIISAIDEIAFQTNLLALNAGVEAARAGDAGRGFAVVASEVRGLAQRSAEAAKEIKTLIASSSDKIEQGVDLVGRGGAAQETIVRSIGEISEIVAGIAGMAKDQASGLSEISLVVTQMDKTTQQNAAMVEETTAATHGLAQETDELAKLVERFDIGTGDARPKRAA